ncbi:hypothetical protein LZ012_06250 [Dechloromonas sp. XY25]|uniref:Uncharacterized protein n=1 Tax=Dechloromonas hankyongensis TaxID=2908002 RepID=A0ABS9K0B5_9RHOO|nr:hypothetical protein [Dechloromonas hankyongensis]MCG2576596.1 hypothetical protein [Dechloromonas hankyongensis]
MKLTRRDFQKLLVPIVATLMLFGAAGALAWWTQTDAEQAGQERNRAAEAKSRIEMRLRQFHSEERDLQERSQLLQRLQDSGVLGEERRLDWMEQLRNTQRDLGIPGMKYEFSAQVPLNKNTPAGYAWFNSPLRLQLRLLHEGDLLNTLGRIQQDAKALVIVRSCKLLPLPASTERREMTARLSADCELDWLTARRPIGRN